MKADLLMISKIDSPDRVKLLFQTLQSLVNTTNFQLVNRIVWVDDGSELVDEIDYLNNKYFLNKTMGLEYVTFYKSSSRLGVGGAKNRGVWLHKDMGAGDLLYIFDSDVLFTDNWLDRILGYHEDYGSEFKIIGGGIHPFLQPRLNEGYSDLTSHDAVSGWSWSLSYETWNRYGKLEDNSLGTGKSEDWEYCQRIRHDGFKVGCAYPQFIAHTGMTNTEGQDIPGRKESEVLAKSIEPGVILL